MLQGATDARLSYSPTSRQLISPVPVPAPTYPPTPIAGSNRPGIVRNMHRELQLVPRGLHVQHAFNETQLKTLLGNLNMGANALRSLNKRVEMVGKLSPQIQRFNYKMSRNSEKVARALKSGKRTVAGRVETSSRTLRAARNTTLENFTELSERLGEMDIGEGAGSFARTLRPYIASVVVLILELLVFQTYLGILTATYIKEVPRLYKRYFLASGVAVFVVFALSIFWLFVTQFQLRKNERLKRQQRQQSEEQSLSPKHEFSNIRHSSFQGRPKKSTAKNRESKPKKDESDSDDTNEVRLNFEFRDSRRHKSKISRHAPSRSDSSSSSKLSTPLFSVSSSSIPPGRFSQNDRGIQKQTSLHSAYLGDSAERK